MIVRRAQVWGLALVVLATLELSCGDPSTDPVASILDLGSPLRRSAQAGAVHTFEVQARSGDLLEVEVEQNGIDIVLSVRAPGGELLARADSPTAGYGPEKIVLVAEQDGVHRVEAQGLAGSGSYVLQLLELGPASDRDRRRAEAHAHFRDAGVAWSAGDIEKAMGLQELALPLAEELGDAWLSTEIHDRLGRLFDAARQWGSAAQQHRLALEEFRRRGESRRIVASLDLLGRAQFRLGEMVAAVDSFDAALELAEEIDDPGSRALLWNNLGLVLRRRGEIDRALVAYGRAIDEWSALGDLASASTARMNLGRLYLSAGEEARALDLLSTAISDKRSLADWQGEAVALDLLGEVYRREGDLAAAMATFERALGLRTAAGDHRGRLVSLGNLARLERARGNLGSALRRQREVFAGFEGLGDQHGMARSLQNLGAVQRDLGRVDDAQASFEAALALYDELGEAAGRADIRVELSSVARGRDASPHRLPSARSLLEEALEIYEQIRFQTLGEGLRRAYFATIDRHYEAYIDLLMEQHRKSPVSGFDGQALAASERARARALLETVERIGQRVEAESRQVEQALAVEIAALARRRDEASSADPRGLETRELGLQIRELSQRLSLAQARSATAPRRLASPPLGVDQIRRQVVDAESQLIVFSLGEARSFLWVLDAHRLTSFELAPRAEIEAKARTAARFLVASRTPEGIPAARSALCDLSRSILGPAAAELTARRLWVVGDGALLAIPFAALPEPSALGEEDCEGSAPLVAAHELVHLPSASVLAALRRARGGADPQDEKGHRDSVAIVADPIFAADDPRLSQPFEPAVSGLRPAFRRLPNAGREAQAILAAAPGGLLVTGADATKEAVLGDRLAGYRFVHFATHAMLDPEQPELSGLALSAFDSSGSSRESQLRVFEISRMELDADLVTLSACRTALGNEVRGEGLIGMTQAFFAAGAAGLLVSLWDVDDAATAELMVRFYGHLLGDGLEPAAALRRSQLALAADPRFAAPYYWSAFVLQGEGR